MEVWIIIIMVLPLLKLGTLALRTLSRPLANRLKQHAAKHPTFRSLIIRFAQSNHRITTQMERRICGQATGVEIRPLVEEQAVQAASDLIGEIFVFAVGGTAVILEVQRNARWEAQNEEIRKNELEEMKKNHADLAGKVQLLTQELEQLAKQRGLSGVFRVSQAQDDDKGAKQV